MSVPADDSVECVVIGAGVVGLAIARRLAKQGRQVLVVEAEAAPGMGTSSRNSEVIHAGIYYPKDSLKARLCVEGKQALYAYCEARGINHRRTGKLIVAANGSEFPVLENIWKKAGENGVADLSWITKSEIERLEPDLEVAGALLSPSTGIVDSHGLMSALMNDAESAGASFAFHAPVIDGEVDGSGAQLVFGGDMEGYRLGAEVVVNAAGLHAHSIARKLCPDGSLAVPDISYAKGNYFALNRRASFSHLIYPVPEPGGLGVHLTLDLAGGVRFGPDVEPIDAIDYTVDPGRAEPFYAAIRRYWPGLRDDDLSPAYSGIRPKTRGLEFGDFEFCRDPTGRLMNLFGIESPGLTSSLAIADHVEQLLQFDL